MLSLTKKNQVKPFIVLLIAFILALATMKLFYPAVDFSLAGKIAMSAMLLFTAIGHFAFSKGMAMMLPSFIPFKKNVVYVTGFIEIAAAIGLLIPQTSMATGWWLIAFFILILPANINAAIHKIDYQKANTHGKGLSYLWLRAPLQIVYIAWIYFFVIAG
jgi:uncharacterized membrane protein